MNQTIIYYSDEFSAYLCGGYFLIEYIRLCKPLAIVGFIWFIISLNDLNPNLNYLVNYSKLVVHLIN